MIIKEDFEYKRFAQLYIGRDKDDVYYLGYPLKLTRTEFAILCALINKPEKIKSSEQIIFAINAEMSPQNLTRHIFNINTKAKIIGDRILIKNETKKGYFLNKEM